LVGVNIYPLLYAVFQSLHNGSILQSGPFVEGTNYSTVLGSTLFWEAVKFTAIFAVAGTAGSYVLGLALALMLRNIPGAAVFRALLLLPWVVPIVVSMTSWNWLIGYRQGLADSSLHALGLPSVLFLASPTSAVLTVCAVKVWETFPFAMLVLGAGLHGIDPSVLEAAAVDGAGPWQRLRHVTLPLLSKVSVIACLLMVIFSVNDFSTVYLLTGGGPLDATQNLVVYSYQLVFNELETGPGVAVALVTTGAMIVLALLLYRAVFSVRRSMAR
jgi:multiple sugar transport system permease protein